MYNDWAIEVCPQKAIEITVKSLKAFIFLNKGR
jgi:hypothetical protein